MTTEVRDAPLDAAVIGLGNIGYLFSRDAKRQGTWSHTHAYRNSASTRLVAGVDPAADKRALFADEFPDVPVFASASEMFDAIAPDIVSICTPMDTHFAVLAEVAAQPAVKGIICEKPFATDTSQAREMMRITDERGIVVSVNHQRRLHGNYRLAATLVADGAIGEVTCVQACYPGQVFNIGTHLVDAVRLIVPRTPVSVTGIQVESPDPTDPSITGTITFDDGLVCTVAATGRRLDLIIEIDVIGREGRVRVIDNGKTIELYRFEESASYSGYRELVRRPLDVPGPGDPLANIVQDMVDVLRGRSNRVACSAEDGYWAIAIVEALRESASAGGAMISLDDHPWGGEGGRGSTTAHMEQGT